MLLQHQLSSCYIFYSELCCMQAGKSSDLSGAPFLSIMPAISFIIVADCSAAVDYHKQPLTISHIEAISPVSIFKSCYDCRGQGCNA